MSYYVLKRRGYDEWVTTDKRTSWQFGREQGGAIRLARLEDAEVVARILHVHDITAPQEVK